MFSSNARYEVEWISKTGRIAILVVFARSASQAETLAFKKLARRKDFKRIEWVSLEE